MDFFKNLFNPSVIWFISGVILFLLELAAPGFVLFFFGVGAWITAIVSLVFDIGLDLQIIIFFVSSILLLISLRRWVQNLFKGKFTAAEKGNEGELIGEKGVVVNAIIPPNRGKIEVHGTNWGAESDVEIPAGNTVEIIAQKNLTLKVKSLK